MMYGQHAQHAQNNKLPPFQGVSPRVTGLTYQSHRGEYVSIILEISGPGEFKCGTSGQPVKLLAVPEAAEVSRICEFVCYVEPSTGDLNYFQHAMLDDEFDFEVYNRLVGLTAKVPQLF